ncbi:MAG: class I SAM-dependent DNA methyltransferase, partial [Verrucomicrobiae bacterium]|nr:class I SAM-dependent DNA methyltransferase [Verrucomicrobiae bacterium]
MNTSRLKRFAPDCRVALMEQIEVKLDYVLTAKTPDLAEQESLLDELRRVLELEGREALIERVAYTWFNRFAAFRYLDAHGWHPFRARVMTAPIEGDVLPELLQQVSKGVVPEELRDFVSASRINDLLDGNLKSHNPQAEVQRLLVIGVSQYYAVLLPHLFDRIDAYTELLLPDDLLTEHSVVHGFVSEITDDDCAEVEILGWLYQFYISDRKDQVMARKSAVPTEDIPAVTQLFTPHWIVRYLVENSLGRLWLLNRPGSRLREHMPYYIEGEKNAPGGSPGDFLKITKPEEIRLCDPAVGSGHMLTYAFDL